MANLSFFQSEFERHSTDGSLGDPDGILGYAYLRVSSSGQAEEGKSGLPRQIARVHEAAASNGIRVPWNMVFADDHTGFQFKNRPELSKLREEYTKPNRRADTVVIEYLDRLSRNADWHQGFLLDEMQQHKITTIFWKGFSSRIERAVMGAISQDGMERTLEILREGRLNKARSGRVTARVPAFGYMLVDSDGKPSPKARKDTYYAINTEEAEIIQIIFQKIGVEGMSTRGLSRYLEDRFPPPRRAQHWQPKQLYLYIRNPLYKGDYYCNRFKRVTVPATRQRPGEPVKMTERRIERPKEEWIHVPVPPIISDELWLSANEMLDKNAKMASRNAKRRQYLLTGLIECAKCGRNFAGHYRRYRWRKDPSRVSKYVSYICASRLGYSYHMRKKINCEQAQIKAEEIEDAVWNVICNVILEPELLLKELENELTDGENAGLHNQIAFLKRQIVENEKEDEKLYRAFMADVFDEHEFAQRRKLLKDKTLTLQRELASLQERAVSHEQIEDDKAAILGLAEYIRERDLAFDPPFESKQRIIKLLVDKIVLDTKEQSFRLEGRIPGIWSLDEPIVRTHPRAQTSWS